MSTKQVNEVELDSYTEITLLQFIQGSPQTSTETGFYLISNIPDLNDRTVQTSTEENILE